jgi:uncharacterized membrane protein YhaH (DUF805 family)
MRVGGSIDLLTTSRGPTCHVVHDNLPVAERRPLDLKESEPCGSRGSEPRKLPSHRKRRRNERHPISVQLPRRRVNRAKWWLFVLGALTWLAVTALPLFRAFTGLLSGSGEYSGWSAESRIAIAITLVVVWWLPLLYVKVAVSVKRLHDRGRSGWWLLLFFLLAVVVSALERAGGNSGVTIGQLAFLIWQIVGLGCLRGTSGPNRHGPDPLGGELSPTLNERPAEPTAI